ncbi:Uncharacterised protein [Candidatus Anstonella stagnisolia]|nr:Uncharacterised protein [Candidatus Anstonella stagnisolia]
MVRHWTNQSVLNYSANNLMESVNENLGSPAVPIGGILPWAKTLAGVPAIPAGFVQCDGQTLSDADSPLNGQTMPALNAATQFLRGNSTSGSTGGSATHTHDDPDITVSRGADGSAQSGAGHSGSHTHVVTVPATASTNQEPPYYSVVFVIRVK